MRTLDFEALNRLASGLASFEDKDGFKLRITDEI